MSDLPHKDPSPAPVYLPAAPGWWLRPFGGTGVPIDSPIIAWRIDGWTASPIIPDERKLGEGGVAIVFKDSHPRAAASDSKEYGLGGRNYAKTRDAKQKADEAKAWQDANSEPAPVGGTRIFPPGDPDSL